MAQIVRPGNAAIVAAVLAACGGAIRAVDPPDDLVAEAETGAADAASEQIEGRFVPSCDACGRAADAADVDSGRCPPPLDPYWTPIFGARGAPHYGQERYDGGVCGVVEAGRYYGYAQVSADLLCALATYPAYPFQPACPAAICPEPGTGACSAEINGAVNDAGECTLDASVTYPVWCGHTMGRRPEGIGEVRGEGRSNVARLFAQQAAFEAVSVVAFERLAGELREHDAPEDLARACEQAAREEADHAATVTTLAQRFGGTVAMPEIAPPRTRALVDLAIENAVEGVVLETYAAAAALYRSWRFPDDAVRAQLAGIADDELSHAELSRRIHRWARTRLSDEENARVDAAIRAAIDSLRDESDDELPDDLLATGVPSKAVARALVAELEMRVWSTDLA